MACISVLLALISWISAAIADPASMYRATHDLALE
jgi:hypothetical protein